MRFGRAALCAVFVVNAVLIVGSFVALTKAQADPGPLFQPRPTVEPSSYPAARTARGKPMRVSDAADSMRLAGCSVRRSLLTPTARGPKRLTLTAVSSTSKAPERPQKRPSRCGDAKPVPVHVEAVLVVWRGQRWVHGRESLDSAMNGAERAISSGAKRARVIVRPVPDHGYVRLPSGYVASWLQESILYCESGARYWLDHPGSSSASGGYGYLDGTWANYGGYGSAYQAPPLMQDRRAEIDLRDGASEWNASRHCWG